MVLPLISPLGYICAIAGPEEAKNPGGGERPLPNSDPFGCAEFGKNPPSVSSFELLRATPFDTNLRNSRAAQNLSTGEIWRSVAPIPPASSSPMTALRRSAISALIS
jgi:hypothetical protein